MPYEQPAPAAQKPTSLFRAIALAGLLVGSLDILSALISFKIQTQKDPVLVLRFIASVVFGKAAAYGDNAMMPVYGLIFHFMIAFIFTCLFFIIYPKLRLAKFHPILTGVLYGVFIWLVMNLAILPIFGINKGFNFKVDQALLGVVILIVMIGMPLSYAARRYYGRIG